MARLAQHVCASVPVCLIASRDEAWPRVTRSMAAGSPLILRGRPGCRRTAPHSAAVGGILSASIRLPPFLLHARWYCWKSYVTCREVTRRPPTRAHGPVAELSRVWSGVRVRRRDDTCRLSCLSSSSLARCWLPSCTRSRLCALFAIPTQNLARALDHGTTSSCARLSAVFYPLFAPTTVLSPRATMTAFASRQSQEPRLSDKPHHSPPPLQQDPFAHQLNPPPTLPQQNPRVAHRASADFRQNSNGAMANGNAPMPVPQGPHSRMGSNGHGHGHGANMRDMGFGGPRSPPNNKSSYIAATFQSCY